MMVADDVNIQSWYDDDDDDDDDEWWLDEDGSLIFSTSY